MRKGYYLSTCDTCKRIIKELEIGNDFPLQDIKTEKITPDQLGEMGRLAGSFEALFSKVARKYKEMELKDKTLTEQDYKNLILSEYTFLKRPVFILNDQIFIGNSKKTVERLKAVLNA